MTRSFRRSAAWRGLVVSFCLLLLVAGCRTYGGEGAEEAAFEQITRAAQLFEQELARVRSDSRALEETAASDSALAAFADEFRDIVDRHAATVERHNQFRERISANSGYRDLKWTLGAIMGEQRAIRSQYDRLLGRMEGERRVEGRDPVRFSPPRPYAIVPQFYERIAADGEGLTMSEALRRYRSAPSEQQMPEAPAIEQENGARVPSDPAGGGPLEEGEPVGEEDADPAAEEESARPEDED